MTRTAKTRHGVTLRLEGSATDEDRVSTFEKSLGITLPREYREFLVAFNGGKPNPGGFRLAERSGPYTSSLVNWLFGLEDIDACDLEKTRQLLEGRMPP